LLAISVGACGGDRRFPLREPMWLDSDLEPVWAECEERETDGDQNHVSCAPEPYVSPLAWDGLDNSIFRPLSGVFAVDPADEAVNVNAFDEVPDSAWFTNRLGKHHPTREELLRGACTPEDVLITTGVAPGSWLIDKGKTDGASLGFRVRINDRKFIFKNDAPGQPDRATAASAVGAAIYHAVGFNTSCEQIVYFDRASLKLKPGLMVTDNSGLTKPFDQAALDRVLREANRRGPLYRMQASAWLPGYLLGPFKYEGTRGDDPNDAIDHEERRDLRGARVLAAWINHFDSREQNSMDSWIHAGPGEPDGSPGFVRHYILDTSDSFGSEWAWDGISRRLGRSYLLDWGDIGADFITLGVPVRSWETVSRKPGLESFGYFGVTDWEPEGWRNEYPNPAFSRATERDNAWMARILSRFEYGDIAGLVSLGQFSNPDHAAYLTYVLENRLRQILQRYFKRLSPLADPVIVNPDQLCLTDLAKRRKVWPESEFRYEATWQAKGTRPTSVAVHQLQHGGVCVDLPKLPLAQYLTGEAPERYLGVSIKNGVAKNPLRVFLYDMGPGGHKIVGVERPEED
jgi:hypothetical protein